MGGVDCTAPRSRRHFLQAGLALAGLGVLAGCGIAPRGLQQPARVHRVGFLSSGQKGPATAPFWEGMAELGYEDGRNVTIQAAFAGQDAEKLPELAAELVRDNVEVIVTNSGPALEAARRVTDTIPIVLAVSNDPVMLGWAASLARPGGNITGQATISAETWGKRLELLKETAPATSQVAVLWNAASRGSERSLRAVQEAATPLRIEVRSFEVRGPGDFAGAFEAADREPTDGLVAIQEPLMLIRRAEIIQFAAERRLPSIYEGREFADAGGLLSLGANLADMHRRAATYVDKILRGAKPADLPIERAAKFDFVVNLRTARALGLVVPPSVLQQATDVIQ